ADRSGTDAVHAESLANRSFEPLFAAFCQGYWTKCSLSPPIPCDSCGERKAPCTRNKPRSIACWPVDLCKRAPSDLGLLPSAIGPFPALAGLHRSRDLRAGAIRAEAVTRDLLRQIGRIPRRAEAGCNSTAP